MPGTTFRASRDHACQMAQSGSGLENKMTTNKQSGWTCRAERGQAKKCTKLLKLQREVKNCGLRCEKSCIANWNVRL